MGSGGSAFVDGGIGAIHALDVFDFYLNGEILPKNEIARVTIIDKITGVKLKE